MAVHSLVGVLEILEKHTISSLHTNLEEYKI